MSKPDDDPAGTSTARGARGALSIGEVVDLLSSPVESVDGCREIASARRILEWLSSHPGDEWQDRWIMSGADDGPGWIDSLIDPASPYTARTQRTDLANALNRLLICRFVFPSYRFLAGYRRASRSLYTSARAALRPDLFAVIESRAAEIEGARRRDIAVAAVTKLVLHTGRDPDQLTAVDLLTYRSWHLCHTDSGRGIVLGWMLLRGIADLEGHIGLTDPLRHGQRPTHELVDYYGIKNTEVRRVLIRYLDERRPALDYQTFTNLVPRLANLFWADIEKHHPEIETLHLPDEVAAVWKQRLRTCVQPGRRRSDIDYVGTLMTVRAFYRDLQEWAIQDPTWAQWSYPSPVSKSELAGQATKAQKNIIAATHQRIRERLPHLPVLVNSAERHRAEQAALLSAIKATPIGETFEHAGRGYRRRIPKSYTQPGRRGDTPPDQVEDLVTGEVIDVGRAEHEAFWAWAVIETLRHTGIRIEELLELTHLGLVSYKLPKTGEVVPMLQIVPSKCDEERLLLVAPELASVLATIITRLRGENGGAVPLTARYDPYERESLPPLPHLFQHRHGGIWKVPSAATIRNLLDKALARTGLTDAAGQPLRYTPHDFRRLWATDSVSNGLPVHIAAKLMGHQNLNTTQTYVAVFNEELVRSYRAFLSARRAQRPEAEYREPTDQEWNDFQQHFEHRKLELGTCGRPYGSPCQHEHACIRCPSLRVDPRGRDRLAEIAANLRDRIAEARANGWTGEVEGLQVSLNAAAAKIATLDRMRARESGTSTTTDLGLPSHQPAVSLVLIANPATKRS